MNQYNILLDERLERILRSRRLEWGASFDRLASYAFAQDTSRILLSAYAKLVDRPVDETRELVVRGELPGQLVENSSQTDDSVVLRDSEMLSIPGLVPAPMAFFACFRCGFDPRKHHDPKVAKAVAAAADPVMIELAM